MPIKIDNSKALYAGSVYHIGVWGNGERIHFSKGCSMLPKPMRLG